MNNIDDLKFDNQICFPMYVCSKGIISKYKPFLEKLNLTYTQYITMLVLWEKNAITVNELGKNLYLDSGTLTPLLKKLENKGLVTRKRSKDDERKTIIKTTNKGFALKEKADEISNNINFVNDMNLNKQETLDLYEILKKLLKSL